MLAVHARAKRLPDPSGTPDRVQARVVVEPAVAIAAARDGVEPLEETATRGVVAPAHRSLDQRALIGTASAPHHATARPLIESATRAARARFNWRGHLALRLERAVASEAATAPWRWSRLGASDIGGRVHGGDAAGGHAGVVPRTGRVIRTIVPEAFGVGRVDVGLDLRLFARRSLGLGLGRRSRMGRAHGLGAWLLDGAASAEPGEQLDAAQRFRRRVQRERMVTRRDAPTADAACARAQSAPCRRPSSESRGALRDA